DQTGPPAYPRSRVTARRAVPSAFITRIRLRANVPDGDERVRVQATRFPSGAQANSPSAKGVTCEMRLTTRPVATDTVSSVERARGGSWPVKNERRRPSRDQWR